MLRLLAAFILLTASPAAIVDGAASGDTAPISLDEIEGAKAARLMKNKEDIDVQSTYHEDEIKDTGDAPNELSARLVKNRGPITAKVMASGTHTRYCGNFDLNCDVQLSLVAWKFAGDTGTVHGHLVEEFSDAEVMKVDVDCMVRKDNEAIVGGVVTTAPEKHPAGKAKSRRAYVKVVANDDGEGDFVSNVYFDDGINSNCRTEGLESKFVVESVSNIVDPRVSVCSKHGDWEKCLKKAKIEQAII